jgi:hypothetical protein
MNSSLLMILTGTVLVGAEALPALVIAALIRPDLTSHSPSAVRTPPLLPAKRISSSLAHASQEET